MKRTGLALLFVMATALTGWWLEVWRLPDRHNPFAPLVVDAPPNWLTSYKLARAKRDPARCAELVQTLDWRAEPLPDRRTGEGCGFSGAWRVSSMGDVSVGEAFPLSCPSVLALAMWQRHTLADAARRHLGEPLQRLQHVGSYACRNVYGRADGQRSQHATAQALDVTGFVFRSGRRIGVQGGWGDPGPEGAFLREAHNGACRWFDGVLGPAYNAAHRDHFHLETRGWHTCR